MLGHLGARGGGDKRCAGGDVEGERAAASGSDDVDQFRAFLIFERDGRGALPHHIDEAGQLRNLLPARGQDGDQGGDFNVGHRAGEDLCKHGGRLLAGERGAVFGERLEEFLQQGHIPIW